MLGKPGENPLKNTLNVRRPKAFDVPLSSAEERLTADSVQIALEAFGLLKVHRCVVIATCRGTVANTTIKAISDEDLEAKVRGMVLQAPNAFEVEGDAVAYVDRLNEDGTTSDWEFDLSALPKTWTATQLIRMLAEANPGEPLSKWIRMARESCGLPDTRKL